VTRAICWLFPLLIGHAESPYSQFPRLDYIRRRPTQSQSLESAARYSRCNRHPRLSGESPGSHSILAGLIEPGRESVVGQLLDDVCFSCSALPPDTEAVMFEQVFVTPPLPVRSGTGRVLIIANIAGVLGQATILVFDLPKLWLVAPIAAWCRPRSALSPTTQRQECRLSQFTTGCCTLVELERGTGTMGSCLVDAMRSKTIEAA